jgi:hypothetical protein
MTDMTLIERLRFIRGVGTEAADEIDRLQRELADCRGALAIMANTEGDHSPTCECRICRMASELAEARELLRAIPYCGCGAADQPSVGQHGRDCTCWDCAGEEGAAAALRHFGEEAQQVRLPAERSK